MSLKALIVEDEEPAKIIIKEYLKKHSDIEIIGEAMDGFTAVKFINEHKPDLIFLDIQLPKLTGFEIIELIEHIPEIIFTTAYDQYAIKAFEQNAIDYLLKPFSEERFNIALHKAKERIENKNIAYSKIEKLKELDHITTQLDRIVVKSNTIIKVIPLDQVIYIEAQDDYVMIYTPTSKHLKEKTMKYFEQNLSSRQFVRIHRSYIVNIDYIHQIEHFTKASYICILKNGTKLKISESGYKLLKERFNI